MTAMRRRWDAQEAAKEAARRKRDDEVARQRRKQERMRKEEELFRRYSSGMGWQPCPECKRMVEKVDGCNHIR